MVLALDRVVFVRRGAATRPSPAGQYLNPSNPPPAIPGVRGGTVRDKETPGRPTAHRPRPPGSAWKSPSRARVRAPAPSGSGDPGFPAAGLMALAPYASTIDNHTSIIDSPQHPDDR